MIYLTGISLRISFTNKLENSKTMAKQINHVKTIFSEAGHVSENLNNTSYYVKSLNKLLNSGIFTLMLAPKGMCFDYKGEKYNCKILVKDKNGVSKWVKRVYFYAKNNISPFFVLNSVAKMLKNQNIKDFIEQEHSTSYLSETVNERCSKCSGRGIIESFKHVCDGVCFDCGGTGFPFRTNKPMVLNINS